MLVLEVKIGMYTTIRKERSKMTNFIQPEAFKKQMDWHWTKELGNVSNEPLRESWGLLAELFRDKIQGVGDEKARTLWHCYSPPTGAGKTEGTTLYAAMLSALSDAEHPGVLIIVRLIEQCRKMKNRINHYVRKYGYRDHVPTGYCIDYHTKQEAISKEDLKDYPVLVITHEAYLKAMEGVGNHDIRETWKFFHPYRDGHRKLLVIDEAVDLVHQVQLNHKQLAKTLSSIPREIQKNHPEAIGYMKKLLVHIGRTEDRLKGKDGSPKEDVLSMKGLPPGVPDFQALINNLQGVMFDVEDLERIDPIERGRLFRIHRKRIKAVETIATLWSFYSTETPRFTINSARVLVPPTAAGPVVLDATGRTNKTYELFKQIEMVDPPAGSRNYQNLTVHTAIEKVGIGKNKMGQDKAKMTASLIEDLNRRLKPSDKALIICHKDVEPRLVGLPSKFEKHVTHWGNLDGSNEWRDCNIVVVFGISFLPGYWSASQYFSLVEKPKKGFSKDMSLKAIRKELQNSKILTDIIQGINRIQSRTVIDEAGNCPPCGCFILLSSHHGPLNGYLLEGIKASLPGVKIQQDWDFTLTAKRVKVSDAEKALMSSIRCMGQNSRVSRRALEIDLGISRQKMDDMVSKLKDEKSPLHQAMIAAKVQYRIQRDGRSQRGYFIKEE